MAGIEGVPVGHESVGQPAEGGDQWHEAAFTWREVAIGRSIIDAAEEAEHGGRRLVVELPESAVEAAAADEAAPGLAHEGRAEEATGIVGRQPEEDLLDEIVHQ